MKNKGLIIGLVSGLLIIILILGIVMGFLINHGDEDDDYSSKSKDEVKEKKDESNILEEHENKKFNSKNSEKVLKKIGKYWYENFYYDSIGYELGENVKSFLGKYSDIGIKVDLENMKKSIQAEDVLSIKELDSYEEMMNVCNQSDTMIVIYPKGEFNKTDYDIEIKLQCQS